MWTCAGKGISPWMDAEAYPNARRWEVLLNGQVLVAGAPRPAIGREQQATFDSHKVWLNGSTYCCASCHTAAYRTSQEAQEADRRALQVLVAQGLDGSQPQSQAAPPSGSQPTRPPTTVSKYRHLLHVKDAPAGLQSRAATLQQAATLRDALIELLDKYTAKRNLSEQLATTVQQQATQLQQQEVHLQALKARVAALRSAKTELQAIKGSIDVHFPGAELDYAERVRRAKRTSDRRKEQAASSRHSSSEALGVARQRADDAAGTLTEWAEHMQQDLVQLGELLYRHEDHLLEHASAQSLLSMAGDLPADDDVSELMEWANMVAETLLEIGVRIEGKRHDVAAKLAMAASEAEEDWSWLDGELTEEEGAEDADYLPGTMQGTMHA